MATAAATAAAAIQTHWQNYNGKVSLPCWFFSSLFDIAALWWRHHFAHEKLELSQQTSRSYSRIILFNIYGSHVTLTTSYHQMVCVVFFTLSSIEIEFIISVAYLLCEKLVMQSTHTNTQTYKYTLNWLRFYLLSCSNRPSLVNVPEWFVKKLPICIIFFHAFV